MSERRRSLGIPALQGVAAVGFEKAVSLGIALYLSRYLTLSDYGRYAFVLAYLNFFQVVPDASLETVLVAWLAGRPAEDAGIAGCGAHTRLVVSVAAGAVGLGVLSLVGGDQALVAAGLIWGAGLAIVAGNPYRPLLRAQLRLRSYAILLSGQASMGLALLAAVVHAGGGLAPTLSAVAGGALGALVLGRWLVGKGVRLRADAEVRRKLVAGAWPLAGTTLVLAGAQQVLQVVLLRSHGVGAVALYGGAQKLVEAVGLLPQALMVSVLPALARDTPQGSASAAAARTAARLLVVVLVPVVIVLGVWAEPVLATVLRPAFAPAAGTLRVLAGGVLLAATGVVLTNLLVAVGRQRTLFWVNAAAASGIVAAGTVLVPRMGPTGMAATLVAGAAGGQLILLVLPSTREIAGYVLGGVVRPLAFGAVTLAVVVGAGAAPALGVVVLALGYPAMLWLTGTVTWAEVAAWGR